MTIALVAAERNSKSAMGNDKKDLTGIFDLQRLQAEDPSAVAENTEQDPFAVNELKEVETIDSFDSIDQIGMMDHPAEELPVEVSAPFEEAATDPFAVTEFETSSETIEATSSDPFAVTEFETPPETIEASSNDPFAVTEFETSSETIEASSVVDSTPEQSYTAPEEAPITPLMAVKNYSERNSGITGSATKVFYPFHLRINGTFGPFERDKLLMFITENPIGLSSSELDLQIQAGKVFLPRISEFSAIKLIQDLRDSGLSFKIHPSDRDEAEATRESPSTFHYQNAATETSNQTSNEIPVLHAHTKFEKPFQEIEEISVVQFVRTDMLEVENSPIIQDVIERMTEVLKQKARLKGGNALMHLQKEITPLRLPSQYQISLKANVIRLT